ncbi:MAG TPA: hypothetical protein CFH81_03030 [Sulfurovum sp. UBA12169]|jgi:hypothetical protein|nr:MAG TPA: hypothetical protein CFH81_03030 [Sulfurovum sp. UBA12169]
MPSCDTKHLEFRNKTYYFVIRLSRKTLLKYSLKTENIETVQNLRNIILLGLNNGFITNNRFVDTIVQKIQRKGLVKPYGLI